MNKIKKIIKRRVSTKTDKGDKDPHVVGGKPKKKSERQLKVDKRMQDLLKRRLAVFNFNQSRNRSPSRCRGKDMLALTGGNKSNINNKERENENPTKKRHVKQTSRKSTGGGRRKSTPKRRRPNDIPPVDSPTDPAIDPPTDPPTSPPTDPPLILLRSSSIR